MPVRITDIAEQITSRQNVYASAYAADLARLRAVHGDAPVQEALALVEQNGQRSADPWDRVGHGRAVARGIDRACRTPRAGKWMPAFATAGLALI